ncbi:grpb/dephospho-CoA kinase [Mariannaea sp. PMI_226]|nr:grpb/dephospho-CoA kinase [Mariannaea sp. PMI_226]
MAPSVEALLEDYEYDPTALERVAFRRVKPPLVIVEPDVSWPHNFDLFKARIQSAIGPVVVAVNHVGSTSVPGLPAKPVIDIDLVVKDIKDEASYVGPLEAAGFDFLHREPGWHEHRFFCTSDPMECNLHVWGPDCPEVERHTIFKNWLINHEDDRELYAKTKREMAVVSVKNGETVMDYNLRKQGVIRDIINRAFRDLGYLE